MTDLQKRILEIFRFVSELCEHKGIRYYAIGGTCLGAVRHHGFIPWDDDMDIAMPIEDYERFISIAKKELPKHYELLLPDEHEHIAYQFMKVVDTRTTAIEAIYTSHKDAYSGVWLDIMPLSGIPGDDNGLRLFRKRNHFLSTSNLKMRLGLSAERLFRGKIMWMLYRPIKLFRPSNYYYKKWREMIKEHPFDKCEYTGYVWNYNSIPRLMFPKDWFGEAVLLDFEDTKIRCPQKHHEFLRQMFGDYMQYPPEEQRNSGHDIEVLDLEHSYKEYQNGTLDIH